MGDIDRALIVRHEAAEVLDTLGVRLLVDHDAAGGSLSANRTVLPAGTAGPPPHFHTTSAELFFLVSGSLRVLAGEEISVLRAGDLLLVPPRTVHAWAAPADDAADVLIVFTPGIERFEYFRLGERILKGEADPRELLSTGDRFDNHFVESPAWQQG